MGRRTVWPAFVSGAAFGFGAALGFFAGVGSGAGSGSWACSTGATCCCASSFTLASSAGSVTTRGPSAAEPGCGIYTSALGSAGVWFGGGPRRSPAFASATIRACMSSGPAANRGPWAGAGVAAGAAWPTSPNASSYIARASVTAPAGEPLNSISRARRTVASAKSSREKASGFW